MDWQTFGHETTKNILKKHILSGNFPHAYLFIGQPGLGKKTLALEFARKILNAEKLETHPDFQILDVAGEITSELVLDFIGKLAFKPFFGPKKIAIINNAENLNTHSSNALLKTLEEPAASTIIILIAGSARLLPTIVSRCQVLTFHPFNGKFLRQFAQAENFEAGEELVDLSFGQLGRLKRLAEDGVFFKQQQELVDQYKKIRGMAVAEKLLLINYLAERDSGELAQDLLVWARWQANWLKQKPQEFARVQDLLEARTSLDQNKNKKLVLQRLFLKI